MPMKTIFMFMALFAGLCTASAQVDTIYTHEGVIPCNVVKVSPKTANVTISRRVS